MPTHKPFIPFPFVHFIILTFLIPNKAIKLIYQLNIDNINSKTMQNKA